MKIKKDKLKHFVYAIPIGMFCSVVTAIGVASALEFKDTQWGGKWDWIDWLCTVAGGIVGNGISLGILMLCI